MYNNDKNPSSPGFKRINQVSSAYLLPTKGRVTCFQQHQQLISGTLDHKPQTCHLWLHANRPGQQKLHHKIALSKRSLPCKVSIQKGSYSQTKPKLLDEPQTVLTGDQVLQLKSSFPSYLKKLMRILFLVALSLILLHWTCWKASKDPSACTCKQSNWMNKTMEENQTPLVLRKRIHCLFLGKPLNALWAKVDFQV